MLARLRFLVQLGSTLFNLLGHEVAWWPFVIIQVRK